MPPRHTGCCHAVNRPGPSRVVLTDGGEAGDGGPEVLPEMVEPPEAVTSAATALLAQQDADGIASRIQPRKNSLSDNVFRCCGAALPGQPRCPRPRVR